jgi:hypothetical protein
MNHKGHEGLYSRAFPSCDFVSCVVKIVKFAPLPELHSTRQPGAAVPTWRD